MFTVIKFYLFFLYSNKLSKIELLFYCFVILFEFILNKLIEVIFFIDIKYFTC
jgi:hypothetical protein